METNRRGFLTVLAGLAIARRAATASVITKIDYEARVITVEQIVGLRGLTDRGTLTGSLHNVSGT